MNWYTARISAVKGSTQYRRCRGQLGKRLRDRSHDLCRLPVAERIRRKSERERRRVRNQAVGGSDEIVYSTLIGGSGYDVARSIAIDVSGCAYVAGENLLFRLSDAGPL